jgi:molecular chaperone DnaK (HSP70)
LHPPLFSSADFHFFFACSILGQFDLLGLPQGPAGSARIEISFHIDEGGVLSCSALDLDSQRHEEWLRAGAMVAHV